jgi:hypothetical protein
LFKATTFTRLANDLANHYNAKGISPDDAPIPRVIEEPSPEPPHEVSGPRWTHRHADVIEHFHVSTPDECVVPLQQRNGTQSYAVPWCWTDSFRWAPSELPFTPTLSDDDGDAWRADIAERWAHSSANSNGAKHYRKTHWDHRRVSQRQKAEVTP